MAQWWNNIDGEKPKYSDKNRGPRWHGTVVKVVCYKSKGRWVDSRWCHWNFSLT
jgi:hypothetical protein